MLFSNDKLLVVKIIYCLIAELQESQNRFGMLTIENPQQGRLAIWRFK